MTDLEEVEEIIKKSGNAFHGKVTASLKEKGWHVLISPYYMDTAADKPREIDLIVEKSWPVVDGFDRPSSTVNLKLFIECKYVPAKTVFWFSDKDMQSTKEWISVHTPLPPHNTYTEKHHYVSSSPQVAKLFSSNRGNVSFESEPIYKGLNQCLNAMVSLRRKGTIIPERVRGRRPIDYTIELPVILCDSFRNFYRVEIDDSRSPVKIDDCFQLEVNYAYADTSRTHRNEYFLIDVVDFNSLDKFLSLLDEDMKAIAYMAAD